MMRFFLVLAMTRLRVAEGITSFTAALAMIKSQMRIWIRRQLNRFTARAAMM
jgi:hypothetical protein